MSASVRQTPLPFPPGSAGDAPARDGSPAANARPAWRYAVGDSDERPWGRWTVVAAGQAHAVKTIEVRPGGRLSLQYHDHRAEHWVVVAGLARVEIDGVAKDVAAGDHVHVPRGSVHRIRNERATPLCLIEIQYGEILDENDIVRLSDDYGRS